MSRLADLAVLLRETAIADRAAAAILAGYVPDPTLSPAAPKRARKTGGSSGSTGSGAVEDSKPPPPPPPPTPEQQRVPFWRVVRRSEVRRRDEDPPTVELPACDPGDVLAQPAIEPIQPWSKLWPRLRTLIADRRGGNAIDARRLVRQVSRGEPLTRLPRREVLRWPGRLRIMFDRSPATVPLWADRNDIIERLGRWCGQVRLGDRPQPGETVLGLGICPPIDPRRVEANGGRACALTVDPTPRRGWCQLAWDPRPEDDRATEGPARVALTVRLGAAGHVARAAHAPPGGGPGDRVGGLAA